MPGASTLSLSAAGGPVVATVDVAASPLVAQRFGAAAGSWLLLADRKMYPGTLPATKGTLAALTDFAAGGYRQGSTALPVPPPPSWIEIGACSNCPLIACPPNVGGCGQNSVRAPK